MGRTPFLHGAIFLLLLALASLPVLCAQAPAVAPPFEIEKLSDQLAELDRQFEEKLAAMRREVDVQAAGKQISEALAASLRWNLRASAFIGNSASQRDLVSTLRIPPENANLAAAASVLDETFNLIQKQRTAFLIAATDEIQRRYNDTLLNGQTAAAVRAVLTAIKAARPPTEITSDRRGSDYSAAWNNATHGLEALEQTLQAIEKRQPEQIRQTYPQLHNALLMGWGDSKPSAAGPARLRELARPFAEEFAAAQDELVAALAAHRPDEELNQKFDQLAESEATLLAVSMGAFRAGTSRTEAFRTILAAVAALHAGDPARSNDAIQAAKAAAPALQGKDSAKVLTLLTTLERDAVESLGKVREERTARFRSRMGSAQGPADLDALATEVRAAFSPRDGQDLDNWNGLAAELMNLAARWAGADSAGYEGRGNYAGRLAPELMELRQKIERDVLSRRLRVPELSSAPLVNLPLPEAFEGLCDQLAEKQEWRRLYDLLTSRPATLGVRGGAGVQDDTVMALRAFFTGQNLELAEQWTQAASAYLMVLQSASPRAPIQAAADRLKDLNKKHPETVPKAGAADPRMRQNF